MQLFDLPGFCKKDGAAELTSMYPLVQINKTPACYKGKDAE